MIPYSAAVEAKMLEMDDEAKAAYLEENKCKPMMDTIVKTGYHILQLCHFYTCGPDEVRCTTIREERKACAALLHLPYYTILTTPSPKLVS